MFTIEISPSSFQDTQFTCIGCELAIKNEGRILELHVQLVIPMNGESCSKDASIFLLDVEFPSSSLRPHRPRYRRGRTPLLVGWRLAGMEQDAGEVEPGLELEGGQEVAVLVHVLGAGPCLLLQSWLQNRVVPVLARQCPQVLDLQASDG